MTDEIQRLRDARPHAAGPSAELTNSAREDLLREIGDSRAPRRRSRRRALPLAAPALAAALAAVVIGVVAFERGGREAWAAPLVRIAQSAPRLLIGESGWHVTRADEFSVEFGEMTFASAPRELELRWQPARDFADRVAKRRLDSDLALTATAGSAEAHVFRYAGTKDFSALWVRGAYTIELRGIAPDVETFKAVLASLQEVDVDTWLSAMPESVVTPSSRAEVVDQMLTGIPLPAGFDRAPLRRGNAIRDRYQLGANVAGAVACAWLEQWVAAVDADDRARRTEAVDALATARSWPVLLDMQAEGDYPEVLWEYADAMASNRPVLGGKPFTVAESYASALGCQSS